MPVASEAHLRERDDLHVLPRGFDDEIAHTPEVVRLVAGRMLELYGRHTDVTHGVINDRRQSARNAIAGSTCAAWRAGRQLTRMHTSASRSATRPYVTASADVTP